MLTSHELIGFMSPSLASELLTFTFDNDRPIYKATMAAVAESRRLRPVFLERQPKAQRNELILNTLTRPSMETAAATLIRGWLMKKHIQLLVDFLNSLGIDHKDGVVDELPKGVEDGKLKAAIEKVLSSHPPEVVAIYLHAFNSMNDTRWENLDAALQNDARLQLG